VIVWREVVAPLVLAHPLLAGTQLPAHAYVIVITITYSTPTINIITRAFFYMVHLSTANHF
jgi:hypothetical protein